MERPQGHSHLILEAEGGLGTIRCTQNNDGTVGKEFPHFQQELQVPFTIFGYGMNQHDTHSIPIIFSKWYNIVLYIGSVSVYTVHIPDTHISSQQTMLIFVYVIMARTIIGCGSCKHNHTVGGCGSSSQDKGAVVIEGHHGSGGGSAWNNITWHTRGGLLHHHWVEENSSFPPAHK